MKKYLPLWGRAPRAVLAAALLGLAALSSADAAQSVTIWIERAPSLNGPWTRLDLKNVPLDANGNPRLPANQPGEFYRTQIELGPSVQTGDPIPLAEVPAEFRTRAEKLLKTQLEQQGEGADPEGWPEGAKIGPHVFPQHAVAGDGSVKPGYFEFKVLLPAVTPPDRGGPVKTDPEESTPEDAGYILLSLTDEDFPICEFSMEGPTPFERLARLAKTSRINVVRYGPTFFAAEDEQGRLLASEGATPFKLDPNVLALDGLEWAGDSDTGLDVSPRIVPKLTAEHYRSYLEFKNDFATGKVYQQLREIKKARAKLPWDVERGRPPAGVSVLVGGSSEILADLPATPAPEFSFITESDPSILQIAPRTGGGLLLTGKEAGEGLLQVRQGDREFVFSIRIVPRITPRAAGDVVASGRWYAGDWSMQPKYHQLKRDRWCDLVGCGPVAWAMLFAWFERNWGVEYAFRGEGTNALPPPNLSTAARRSQVIDAYDSLHELCDVICNPFGDDGATYPTDMTDAFKGYTYPAALANQIGRYWNINSVTGTWPDLGALRSRDAIKNGYPAVTGLGWMWHYVLAYGYGYDTVDTGVGFNVTYRYLKCNMGWNGHGPRWYYIGDTFYSARCKLWSGPNG